MDRYIHMYSEHYGVFIFDKSKEIKKKKKK